jgi:hypothetical protein
VSPILSNIYLDKLDKFVEQELIPQYTRGGRRRLNPEYNRTAMRLKRTRKRGDRAEARDLLKQLRTLPRDDPMDPGYRRLKYLRYADLCRARHKSAYAEVRIMPTGCWSACPWAGRRRGGGITRRVLGVARGCRGTRAGCPAAGSVPGWCRAAGRGRGPVP